MADRNIAEGVVIDEASTVTLEELASACRVETRWIIELVEEGVLSGQGGEPAAWRFRGIDLIRVRKIRRLQSCFEASPAAAAVMLDLREEVERLRSRLRRLGLDES